MKLGSLPIGGVLGVLLFGGCSDRRPPPEVTLRVANWGSPAVESSFMTLEREIQGEFERRHPGVRVRMEQIPGQYAPKVVMMHVAGCAPDVIALDSAYAALFIDNGVLLDLAPRVASDPSFDVSSFFPNVLEIARRAEALYAIPLDFTPMVMYYNRTLFDKVQVPYPREGWTWDDFLATCKALTVFPTGAARPAQYGFNFENEMYYWVLWLWTNGGDVLDAAGRQATGSLDGPAATQAIQFVYDLIFKHRVAPSPAERAALGGDPFLNGLAAMDLKGHWMLIDYRARNLDVGVVSLPTRTGRPVTVIYEAGLSITRDSRHPDLAWEYIKYMTSQEVQTKRVASGLAISANRLAAQGYAGSAVEDAFLAAASSGRSPWGAQVERYKLCEDLGRDMMDDILYGAVPIPEALRETAKLMDAVLVE